MKILTVIMNLNKGGTQRVAQTFAEAYLDLGHESRVLSLYGLGVRVEEIKSQIQIWHTLSSSNLKEISDWKADIIHIHSHGPHENDIKLLLDNAKSTHTKIIETNVFSKPSPWCDRVDVTFQLSHWAQWLFNLRGGQKYNSIILPNPIKCESFQIANTKEISEFKNKYNIPNNSFVIGRIGQSYPGKWSPMLVNVFNELATELPSIYLMVVNPPNNVIEQIQNSPFFKRIVVIDKIIGDKNLSIAYSSMDTMLLTVEQGESFGIVSAESILCGTPVIALATPWGDNSQCEVVGHLQGGYVVHTKLAIINAIKLIYNKSDTLDITTRGYRHIFDNYNAVYLAKKALNSVENTEEEKNKDVLGILYNSLDTPNLLTRWLIKANHSKLRTLTIYTSGYYGVGHLVDRLLKKLKTFWKFK